MKRLFVFVVWVLLLRASFALDPSGLIHRWSFNGDMRDSVGSVSAVSSGTATLGPSSIALKGGANVCLKDVIPLNATAITVEFWFYTYQYDIKARIVQIGAKTGDPIRVDARDGHIFPSLSALDDRDTDLGFGCNNEYRYCAVVANKLNNGSWQIVLYAKDPAAPERTGGMGTQIVTVQCSSNWSLSDLGSTDVCLGFDPEEGEGPKELAALRFEEVRVWNRALGEEELNESVCIGRDVQPGADWRFAHGDEPNLFAVTNVVAKQRYPWNGVVDIEYDLQADCGTKQLEVYAVDETTGEKYYAYAVSGDVGTNKGHHRVSWDLSAQNINLCSPLVRFCVSYESPYRVFELGDNPCGCMFWTYEDVDAVPVGGWTDAHKTHKLVMRRCPAGRDALGRDAYQIPRPFYIGVFELTEDQRTLIGYGSGYWGELFSPTNPLPVYVSPSDVRGELKGVSYPDSTKVEFGSIIGQVRRLSGIQTFDLPTEVQWEYACRAGTTTANYLGDVSTATALQPTAWVHYSGNERHAVGLKDPSPWGLYDMYGNMAEMVLVLTGGYSKRGGGYPDSWQYYSKEYSSSGVGANMYASGLRLCFVVE